MEPENIMILNANIDLFILLKKNTYWEFFFGN